MFSSERIISCMLCGWLLMCSWQDIKEKKVRVIVIGLGLFILIGSIIIDQDLTIWNRLAGLSLGIVLLSLNLITKGQIGMGDGLIVSITGLCLGFSQNVILLLYSLFGSAIFSLVLIILYRVNRKKTIPFIPFLLLAYVGVVFIG